MRSGELLEKINALPSNIKRKTDIARALGVSSQRIAQVLHPEKQNARAAVTSAIKTGRLTRPEICENCNGRRDNIEAHHPDYSKPLDVLWLCTTCHGEVHRFRKIKPAAKPRVKREPYVITEHVREQMRASAEVIAQLRARESTFNVTLKSMRTARGIKQCEVAEAIHADVGYICRFESDSHPFDPREGTIDRIAQFLKLSSDERDQLFISANKLPPEITVTLLANPKLMKKVRRV